MTRLATRRSLLALCALPGIAGAQATLRGVAWDSVAKRPLAGAVLQVARADNPAMSRVVTAADDGRYTIDSLGLGTWLVGLVHPALDALGLDVPMARVTITGPGSAELSLGIPSAPTLRRSWCGALADSGGVWLGRVRRATDGALLEGATVVAEWNRIVARGRAVVRETPSVGITAGESGAFRACGLPMDELLRAQAWQGADTSGVLTFALPTNGLLQRDVYVAPSVVVRRRVAVDSAAGDSGLVEVELRVGSGRARGRVVGDGERAVGAARVRLAETGAEAVTNSDGWFTMDSLPLGSWTFDARAIGFMSQSRQVDVVAGEVATPTFVLDSRQAFLDTVKVTARRVVDTPWHQDFLDRKRRGFGYFVDGEEIEKRNAMYVTDLVRSFPGVYVAPGGFGGTLLFRATSFGRGYCRPDVFVNGMYISLGEGESVENFVSTLDVAAVEAYPRTAGVPAQYQRMNGCGALLVWTGARARREVPPER